MHIYTLLLGAIPFSKTNRLENNLKSVCRPAETNQNVVLQCDEDIKKHRQG